MLMAAEIEAVEGAVAEAVDDVVRRLDERLQRIEQKVTETDELRRELRELVALFKQDTLV